MKLRTFLIVMLLSASTALTAHAQSASAEAAAAFANSNSLQLPAILKPGAIVILPPVVIQPGAIKNGFGGVSIGGGQIFSRSGLCSAFVKVKLKKELLQLDNVAEIHQAAYQALTNMISAHKRIDDRFMIYAIEKEILTMIRSEARAWNPDFNDVASQYCENENWDKIPRLNMSHLEYFREALPFLRLVLDTE